MNENSISSDLLVVGGGIAGMTAAIEAAETGVNVILVEKNPYIGGRVSQFNEYFPKLCPPTCGLEINIRRLKNNSAINLYTLAEVSSVSGEPGNYQIEVKVKPRFVTNQCTVCGDCVEACPETRKNEFNYMMDETKAIYIPYQSAYPQKYVIDENACKGSSCNKCVDVCKYDAIDLEAKEKTVSLQVKSIIWATGWDPYDANKLDILGFKEFDDVITNVMMERYAAKNGPTNGKIIRPSTGEEIKSIAFVQCAGSRDKNHLDYCSSVCCMASMKQAQYIREQYPEADIHIHYIDVRANGLFEDFYRNSQNDEKIYFHRGKVAKVIEDPESKQLIVEAENSLKGDLMQNKVDMVVLATGMQPNVGSLPIDKSYVDENGFFNVGNNGMISCGVSTNPKDVSSVVQEATGAVLKAIQIIKES